MLSRKYTWVTLFLSVFVSLVFSSLSTAPSAKAQARRYEINCSAKLWKASFDSTITQLGVKEKTGNNDGVQVEKYLRSVGLPKGNPYCMAGQYWSFTVAAARLQESVTLLKSGLASAVFNFAAKTGVQTAAIPHELDLIFWKFAKTVSGHVARIEKIGRAGWITTIEYNTGSGISGNQRDSGGNYRRQRNIDYPLGRMNLLGYIGAKA